MDFKKFGRIVLIIGVLIFLYGGIQWLTNQPKQFNSAESRQTILGRDDLGNMLSVNMENSARSANRDEATTIMIVGGIVCFIGFGISYSTKTGTINYANKMSDNSNSSILFCPNCGKKYTPGTTGEFCDACGNKL
jgi:hypothetical protein